MGGFTPCLIGDRGIYAILEGRFFQDPNSRIKNRVFQRNRPEADGRGRSRIVLSVLVAQHGALLLRLAILYIDSQTQYRAFASKLWSYVA